MKKPRRFRNWRGFFLLVSAVVCGACRQACSAGVGDAAARIVAMADNRVDATCAFMGDRGVMGCGAGCVSDGIRGFILPRSGDDGAQAALVTQDCSGEQGLWCASRGSAEDNAGAASDTTCSEQVIFTQGAGYGHARMVRHDEGRRSRKGRQAAVAGTAAV